MAPDRLFQHRLFFKMEFVSANRSVIRSIMQRVMLDAWLRARRKSHSLPSLSDFVIERASDELADMMGFDVEGSEAAARLLITQEGARLAATYGDQHIPPEQRTNRYLDHAIGLERYAHVLPSYRACLRHRRPTYSIWLVQDADGKEVSYERLLLPFGSADVVEQIIGSYKAISIEGSFKVDNLMGISSRAAPRAVVSAVIELEPASRAQGARIADDIIEV
jgi:hypothetical protein